MCLPWSEKPTYACSGGKYKVLDSDASDIASCQAKCLQEQQIGCCYFKPEFGCQWMAGGSAHGRGNAMATTCYPGKNYVEGRLIE